MARSNPTTNAPVPDAPAEDGQPKRAARLSLLEAGACEPEVEMEPNPLGIINILLALRKPEELIDWLDSESDDNYTKLVKFVIAVRDKYDELAADYNQLEVDRDELLASRNHDNTRDKVLMQKEGVIKYLKDQVAALTAENHTLRRAQEQAIVDPPVSHGDNEKHEVSPGPSTNSISARKHRLKLQDPPVFTDGKDGLPVEHWLVKMDGKMTADEDLMDTPKRRMVYVMKRVGGTAFDHLEPRARKNATRPWKDSDEMLAYLKQVFGDSNRRENAENEFRALRQSGKDFNTFWAEFQRLAMELDRNDATLISDLTSKLSYQMLRQLNTGDKRPTDLLEYAERCQRVYQGLKDVARAKAASERYMEKRAAARATTTTPAKKVTTSTTTTRTPSSTVPGRRVLTASERERLMREGRCFSCKEVGHRTTECSNEWKPMSSLAV